MERAPAFSQHYEKRHRLDVGAGQNMRCCRRKEARARRQFGDTAAQDLRSWCGRATHRDLNPFCNTATRSAAIAFDSPSLPKNQADRGFPGPFVDSPILAGFTLLGLWGAPSAAIGLAFIA